MIWQAPWAWIGLLSIAIPIAVHLLTQRQAPRALFPTLRFLVPGQLSAVRRHRLTDVALLLVRGSILAAAVMALAQPYLLTPARVEGSGSRLARAVVIDTSASMTRPTPGGRPAIDEARGAAAALTPAATDTISIEQADLRLGLAGARAWLDGHPGRRELVVVSDFQIGAIDRSALASVAGDTSVRLVKIDTRAETTVSAPAVIVGDREVVAHADVNVDRTAATWETRPAGATRSVTVFASTSERAAADAALAAARAMGVRDAPSDQPVAVVLPGAPERATLVASARPLDRPWMFDVMNRLRTDRTLGAAARGLSVTASGTTVPRAGGAHAAPITPAILDVNGAPLVSVARADVSGVSTVIVLPASTDPLLSAAVFAALLHADAASLAELEPFAIAADDLRQWERPAETGSPRANVTAPPGESDGRWFWGVALVLLGLETWLRRKTHVTVAGAEVPHARVA